MGNFGRRMFLAGGSALVGAGVGRWLLQPQSDPGPVFPKFDSFSAAQGNILNDMSQLEPTQILKHVPINSDIDSVFIHRVRALLIEAREKKHSLIASTARHSMGGHSLPEKGTALTLVQTMIKPDVEKKTYRVAAGTTWRTVVHELDKIGFSPAVMQSNNDFGVGSTFSVNAHGWPVPHSGCGSTVRSIKIMVGNGTIQTCSREQNADLFYHAMGGYGLIGVITELELEMVPNVRLTPTYERMPGAELGKKFYEIVKSDDKVNMAYGRLDVSLDSFFKEGLLITYRPSEDQTNLPPPAESNWLTEISRFIFRNQLGSDFAKTLRWWNETLIGPEVGGETTRNGLINEAVIAMDDRDPFRTDILHEYFVPPDKYADFIAACRDVIPASYQQLLNVTVRYVAADKESVLAYAPGDRISSVFLFSQEKTERAEADMAHMTHALIERVIALGGTYYLPYRPHATLDQFVRAYPHAKDFAAFKRQSDKDLIFRNRFWDRYVSQL